MILWLIVSWTFVFAVFSYYLFAGSNPAEYGNVGVAMLTLTNYAIGDNWLPHQRILDDTVSPWTRVFTLCYQFLTYFIALNLCLPVVMRVFSLSNFLKQVLFNIPTI